MISTEILSTRQIKELTQELKRRPQLKLKPDLQHSLQSQCHTICEKKSLSQHPQIEKKKEIALLLATYLLENSNVDFIWVTGDDSHKQEHSIMDYISYLDMRSKIKLLEAKLNLNPIKHGGVAMMTWMIADAMNNEVFILLLLAEKYQTKQQVLNCVNKTDKMGRTSLSPRYFCSELFSNPGIPTPVEQTPLQVAIAKGYKNTDGADNPLSKSNLQLAQQLLRLGAIDTINYQEPTLLNTALHMACARRDLPAIDLLVANGASQEIQNVYNKIPRDMLDLNFEEAQDLLKFHTEPHRHQGRTFYLNQDEFNCPTNLAALKMRLATGPASALAATSATLASSSSSA
jgi:DNA polymerase III delta prime subunit